MRITVLLFFVLGITSSLFSQEAGEVVREGKKYTLFVVKEGTTLYSLHQKYKVEVEAIKDANPSIKEGLQIGQRLYIPKNASNQQETSTDKAAPAGGQGYKIHIVKKKETLFGISRKYNCDIEEIVQLNPEAENGLDIGQELKIPTAQNDKSTTEETNKDDEDLTQRKNSSEDTTSYVYTDSIVHYTVKKGETLYAISKRFMVSVDTLKKDNDIKLNDMQPGQELIIRLKKEHGDQAAIRSVLKGDDSLKQVSTGISIPKKKKYKIAIILPLKFDKNPDVLSGMFDRKTGLNKLTNLSTEFYMGAQMALDSLEKMGLSATVKVVDTRGNLDRLKSFLGTSNKNNFDLVIGPFYPKLITYTAAWGKQNKTPIIAVTKVPMKLLKDNPYLFSMIPSEMTLLHGMAVYLAKYHSDDNIVLINGESKEVNDRIDYFKTTYQKNLPEGKGNTIKMSSLGDASGRVLVKPIQPDTSNFLICLSSDVKQVMKFVNTSNAVKNYTPKLGKTKIEMVGLQEWMDIESFNSYYKNRFNFHFAAANYLNYDLPQAKQFTIDYRKRYKSDPSKFAFHGFDVILSQTSDLLLGYDRSNGIMNDFSLRPVGLGNGQENSSVFILQQDDFMIQLNKIISKNDYFVNE